MTMSHTAFYFNELCMWHSTGEAVLTLPVGGWLQPIASGGHPESAESKRRLKSLLDVSGLSDQLLQLSAEPVSDEDLYRVHDQEYIARFRKLSEGTGGEIGSEAWFSHGGFEIAKLSAGLAKQAVSDVLSGQARNAYALCRPPGHHCLPNEGMGFCLLANISIAIEAAKAECGLGRVAVLDWDVHHGNGTQSIFYGRQDVLTISLHQDRCFPTDSGTVEERGVGKGNNYNINIPLPPGSGHEAYLYALERLVLPALESYQPELIVVACGLDANAADPLARQMLYSGSFREMMNLVVGAADMLCEGRVVAIHEGGYAESIVPFCGLAVVEALCGIRTEVVDPFEPLFVAQQPSPRIVEMQKSIINEIADDMGFEY